MLTPLQKFVFVCFILVIGTWRLAEYLICWQTWDEVPATVEAVSIDEIPGDGGLPDYRVSIRYRFVSAGEAFESGQLDFFGGETFVFSDPGAAEAEALKWRRDPPDTCRVHPRDPRRSAILPLKELDFSIILFAMRTQLYPTCPTRASGLEDEDACSSSAMSCSIFSTTAISRNDLRDDFLGLVLLIASNEAV